MITLKKDVYVNICKKVTNHKKTAYGRDNTKQEEMPYFHCGPLSQEKVHQIRTKERAFNIKKTVVVLRMIKIISIIITKMIIVVLMII